MKQSIKHTQHRNINKIRTTHTHSLSEERRESAVVCLKKCTVKTKFLFANVFCVSLLLCAGKKSRAPISFFFDTNQHRSEPTLITNSSSSRSISFFSRKRKLVPQEILFLLLVRGSVACAPAPARRKTGIYYYGCVFIILINNGKNSYYYTLEYMKQRLFGKNERESQEEI